MLAVRCSDRAVCSFNGTLNMWATPATIKPFIAKAAVKAANFSEISVFTISSSMGVRACCEHCAHRVRVSAERVPRVLRRNLSRRTSDVVSQARTVDWTHAHYALRPLRGCCLQRKNGNHLIENR
jgi:hypothetical protein